jgi:glycyl-tRNA synthetase
LFLALLTSAYDEDTIDGEPRKILRFHPAVAPVKVAVYPLVKNKPEIIQIARDLFEKLQMRYNCEWDTSGTIGKRYRRSDENGTPYCITVDYESITDGSVTVRDRDTTQQTRMKISDLFSYFSKEIDGL